MPPRLNAAHPLQVAHSSCSTVSADGFDVYHCLSSSHSACNDDGWRAASFVKSPVSLIFELASNSDIHALSIRPTLSLSAVKVLAVHVSSALSLTTAATTNNSTRKKSRRFDNNDELHRDDSFRMCGKVTLDYPMPTITLVNPDLADRRVIGRSGVSVLFNTRFLRGVRFIRIDIIQMFESRTPALGSIAFWGIMNGTVSTTSAKDSITTSDDSNAAFTKTATSHSYTKRLRPSSPVADSPTSSSTSASSALCFSVPEEFLDIITVDIMTEPVILPSGNIVDRSTILRHLRSSRTDPFTGRTLTIEDIIPHPRLKARIDAWMLSDVGRQAMLTDDSSKSKSWGIGHRLGGRGAVTETDGFTSVPLPSKVLSSIPKSLEVSSTDSLKDQLEHALNGDGWKWCTNSSTQHASSSTNFKSNSLVSMETCRGPICGGVPFTLAALNIVKPSHTDVKRRLMLPCGCTLCACCVEGVNGKCPICNVPFDKRNVVRVHVVCS